MLYKRRESKLSTDVLIYAMKWFMGFIFFSDSDGENSGKKLLLGIRKMQKQQQQQL